MKPDRELDLTRALTAAVAHELWRHCGGNEVVNWLEAERFVAMLCRLRSSQGLGPAQHRQRGRRSEAMPLRRSGLGRPGERAAGPAVTCNPW